MRESIGGAWLLGIVMVFMMVFVAFISITINYSKAYKVKTEVVNAIEEYQGFNNNSINRINSILQSEGYRSKGLCGNDNDSDTTIFGVLDGNVTKNPTVPQNYCVTLRKGLKPDTYYYKVNMFFAFSLPVVGDIYTFIIDGETNAVIYPVNIR